MNSDKLTELRKKNNEISLFISRIPMETKREFKYLAEAGFCGDYGLCLRFILQQSGEYQSMKSLFFDKLQNMENKIDEFINKIQLNEEESKPSFKTLGRRELKGGNK